MTAPIWMAAPPEVHSALLGPAAVPAPAPALAAAPAPPAPGPPPTPAGPPLATMQGYLHGRDPVRDGAQSGEPGSAKEARA